MAAAREPCSGNQRAQAAWLCTHSNKAGTHQAHSIVNTPVKALHSRVAQQLAPSQPLVQHLLLPHTKLAAAGRVEERRGG